MLTEPLNAWLSHLQFDFTADDCPYLFHVERDAARCVGSSQWSQMVKSCFQRHAGVATPPKLLRSSFVTWLKDTVDDSPNASEILKSAAKAMWHLETTQGSDKYDKKSHDRLTSAATAYVEQFAKQSTTAPCPEGWVAVDCQPSFEFVRDDAGSYVCMIDCPALQPDTLYCFPTVPGLPDGLTWKTPSDVAG